MSHSSTAYVEDRRYYVPIYPRLLLLLLYLLTAAWQSVRGIHHMTQVQHNLPDNWYAICFLVKCWGAFSIGFRATPPGTSWRRTFCTIYMHVRIDVHGVPKKNDPKSVRRSKYPSQQQQQYFSFVPGTVILSTCTISC